jgi:DNA-directed RNA polymerase sigma subunit (sigma70/sigma32)
MTTRAGSAERLVSLTGVLAELPIDESFVIRARYGIGGAQLSDHAIADQLGVTIDEVWEMDARALEALGFFLLVRTGVFDAEIAKVA